MFEACLYKTETRRLGDRFMPDFIDPFSGMTPDRKMTHAELVRAIRLNLCAEQEAVHLYTSHADATDDPLAREVLIAVANEERVHAGEFQRLLSILEPDEDRLLAEGAQEVNDEAEKLAGNPSDSASEVKPPTEVPSIGNLK